MKNKLNILCCKYYEYDLNLYFLNNEGILVADFRIDCINTSNIDIILRTILKDVVSIRPSFYKTNISYLEYLINLEFQDENSETYIGNTSISQIYHDKIDLCISNVSADLLKQIINLNKTKILYNDTKIQKCVSELDIQKCVSELNIQKLILQLTYYD